MECNVNHNEIWNEIFYDKKINTNNYYINENQMIKFKVLCMHLEYELGHFRASPFVDGEDRGEDMMCVAVDYGRVEVEAGVKMGVKSGVTLQRGIPWLHDALHGMCLTPWPNS